MFILNVHVKLSFPLCSLIRRQHTFNLNISGYFHPASQLSIMQSLFGSTQEEEADEFISKQLEVFCKIQPRRRINKKYFTAPQPHKAIFGCENASDISEHKRFGAPVSHFFALCSLVADCILLFQADISCKGFLGKKQGVLQH